MLRHSTYTSLQDFLRAEADMDLLNTLIGYS
jgi:hypothetical protein